MKLLIFLLIGVISVHQVEGITKSAFDPVPVYQYYAVQSDGNRYYYSTDPNYGQGWTFDKIAFETPKQIDPHCYPVYQYHYDQSGTYGGLRYTFSMNPNLADGWTLDKYAFSAYTHPHGHSYPVYQYHAVQNDGYRYLFSKDSNVGGIWILDEIAFYSYGLY